MKTIYKKLFLAVVLVTFCASAQAPTVQVSPPAQFSSGTDVTAILAAQEQLKTIYGVTDDQIVANVREAQGESAIVKASLPGYTCDMALMKNDAANRYGLIIHNLGCRKN